MIMPIDIENKVFKKTKFGGYEISEVEDFLEAIIVDYEKLQKENASLKEKLEKSDDTIHYYASLEDGLTQSLENSQKAAEEIRERAILEAEEIKKDAKQQGNIELEKIGLEIKAKEIAFEQIKQQMEIYKIKVSSMLEAQLKILNESEK